MVQIFHKDGSVKSGKSFKVFPGEFGLEYFIDGKYFSQEKFISLVVITSENGKIINCYNPNDI